MFNYFYGEDMRVFLFCIFIALSPLCFSKEKTPVWDEAFEVDAICGMAHEKAAPCAYIKNINIHFQQGVGIDEKLYESSRSYLDNLILDNKNVLSKFDVAVHVDKFFGVLMNDIKKNKVNLEVLFVLEKNEDEKSINLIFSVFSKEQYYVSVKNCSFEYKLCIEQGINKFFQDYIILSIKKNRN